MSRPLRIAYLSDSAIPSRLANGVHVMRMSRALHDAGADVTLYAKRGEDRGADHFAAYGVTPNFTLRFVPRLPVPWPALWTALHSVFAARRAGTDLLYTRSVYTVALASLLGLPVAIEMHAKLGARAGAKAALIRRALRRGVVRGIVVISEPLRMYYTRVFGLGTGQVHVAPDGADPVPDSVAPKPLRNNGRLSVGYVGQLFPGRGIELIAELAARLPNVDFHVVGGFDKDIDAWRARTDGQDNLTFRGFVPAAETPAYLKAFDVALAPYQERVTILGQGDSSEWMSPMKLFEYMAAGTAIVASDLPAIRTVLRDEETALRCPPADADAWAAALTRLEADPGLRERLGANARADLDRHYTWDRRAADILAWLDRRAAQAPWATP
jgi:glycosyltransferase involved in cell wall biosynthesis